MFPRLHQFSGGAASSLWRHVFVPFILTRLWLLLVGMLAVFLPTGRFYGQPDVATRGWAVSPHRLLDMWARWDSGWYLSIVNEGYTIRGDLATTQSNIAFFPLYPWTVKALSLLLPASWRTQEVILLLGVLVSNVCLVTALVLLYRFVEAMLADQATARYTVALLLVFPVSFFFSCFYTESLFLLLSLVVFVAASRGAWAMAGICGFLAALTRHVGIFLVIPLLWMYLERVGFNWRRISPDALWLALIPAGLTAFLLYTYPLTGDILGPLQVQKAWSSFTWPWDTILRSKYTFHYIAPFDVSCMIVFPLLAVISLKRLPSASYGLYAICTIIPSLLHGTTTSVGRFCLVIFPVFIVSALLLNNHHTIRRVILIVSAILLSLYMALWSQFYWIE